MEIYDLYSTIDSFLQVNECAWSNSGHEMRIMEDEIFDLPLSTGTWWHSSLSGDLNTRERVFQQSVYSHGAFSAYIKADSNASLESVKTGQVLHKRSLEFLRKFEEKSKKSSLTAGNNNEDQQPKSGFQKKSTFQHITAQRNRRAKLREHFLNLSALLPTNSKQNEHSILANTTIYLKELKLCIAELEQQNQILKESTRTKMSDNDQRSRGFESQSFNSESTLFYHRDGVSLEQSQDIPCQVNIKINVQTDPVSYPTTLLINVIEQLRLETLQVLSIHSDREANHFHANIIVRPKGEAWNTSKWRTFGDLVRRSLQLKKSPPNK